MLIIKLYYADDAPVQDDRQLQFWTRKLISFDGRSVRHFGEDGSIKTRDYLIDAATMIIFAVSA